MKIDKNRARRFAIGLRTRFSALGLKFAYCILFACVFNGFAIHAVWADETLNPTTPLRGGGTIGQLGALVAKAEAIRSSSLSSVPSAEYLMLIRATGVTDDDAVRKASAKFFMRGAIGFPILAPKNNLIVFYNPAADVALVSSWKINYASTSLSGARFLPGERLGSSSPLNALPRWTNADEIASAMRKMTQDVQTATLDLQRLPLALDLWINTPADPEQNALIIKRLASVAVATADTTPCSDQFNEIGSTVGSLRDGSLKSNMDPKTPYDDSVLSVGGLISKNFAMRIYSVKRSPSYLIFALADPHNRCSVVATSLVNMLPSPSE